MIQFEANFLTQQQLVHMPKDELLAVLEERQSFMGEKLWEMTVLWDRIGDVITELSRRDAS